jgi:hypothetical protein
MAVSRAKEERPSGPVHTSSGDGWRPLRRSSSRASTKALKAGIVNSLSLSASAKPCSSTSPHPASSWALRIRPRWSASENRSRSGVDNSDHRMPTALNSTPLGSGRTQRPCRRGSESPGLGRGRRRELELRVKCRRRCADGRIRRSIGGDPQRQGGPVAGRLGRTCCFEGGCPRQLAPGDDPLRRTPVGVGAQKAVHDARATHFRRCPVLAYGRRSGTLSKRSPPVCGLPLRPADFTTSPRC